MKHPLSFNSSGKHIPHSKNTSIIQGTVATKDFISKTILTLYLVYVGLLQYSFFFDTHPSHIGLQAILVSFLYKSKTPFAIYEHKFLDLMLCLIVSSQVYGYQPNLSRLTTQMNQFIQPLSSVECKSLIKGSGLHFCISFFS